MTLLMVVIVWSGSLLGYGVIKSLRAAGVL